MKKVIYLIIFVLGTGIINAKPVSPAVAKNLAAIFYKQHSAKIPQTMTLAYTETSPSGEALYYVFNVNTNDGFVIITADDALHPIIGYSTENKFVMPEEKSNVAFWMEGRKKEIMTIKSLPNLVAGADVAREWSGDFVTGSNLTQRSNGANAVSSSVAPLVQSTWNQNPYYNKICPSIGGSQAVTGFRGPASTRGHPAAISLQE